MTTTIKSDGKCTYIYDHDSGGGYVLSKDKVIGDTIPRGSVTRDDLGPERPSHFPIDGLEKYTLDGQILYIRKFPIPINANNFLAYENALYEAAGGAAQKVPFVKVAKVFQQYTGEDVKRAMGIVFDGPFYTLSKEFLNKFASLCKKIDDYENAPIKKFPGPQR